MNLSTFWKKRTKITIILKSGKEISFKCDEFSWKFDSTTGNLTSWSFTGGGRGLSPRYINPSEIAAILRTF